jgi:hypothetical protein
VGGGLLTFGMIDLIFSLIAVLAFDGNTLGHRN